MIKILYESTYATRGRTGIPRDAASVAKMLTQSDEVQTDLMFNPRNFTRRTISKQRKTYWESNALGDALRREAGRMVIPKLFTSGLIFFQSLSLRRNVPVCFLTEKNTSTALEYLNLLKPNRVFRRTRIALIPLSYFARFLRPAFLKPFSLAISQYDVFIQQQLDPISVGKKTIHVVRLHDFLPVTHPQLFEQNAVKIFTKSLKIMMKNRNKIWVMDSEATVQEFKEYFGADLDVRVIPCSIALVKSSIATMEAPRKNQICIVNTIEPRKRVSLAISGFRQAKLLGKLSPDWELVIIGAEGWNEKPLASGLRKGIFGKDVIYKEDVDDFELQRVFNESRIVLSAAAAEGFGLPPLEGMSSGCIPVVSDIPQHRETVRENGLYFSGNEPTAIANALEEASILSEQNGTEIATKLRNYVEANYSEKVIGEKWIDFINSLKK